MFPRDSRFYTWRASSRSATTALRQNSFDHIVGRTGFVNIWLSLSNPAVEHPANLRILSYQCRNCLLNDA